MTITGNKLMQDLIQYLHDNEGDIHISELVTINNTLGLYCVNSYNEDDDTLDVN